MKRMDCECRRLSKLGLVSYNHGICCMYKFQTVTSLPILSATTWISWRCSLASSSYKKKVDPEAALFECNEAGCSQLFDSFEAFQDHVNFGHHTPVTRGQESMYDKLCCEWVLKFSSTTVNQETLHQPCASTGWRLHRNP